MRQTPPLSAKKNGPAPLLGKIPWALCAAASATALADNSTSTTSVSSTNSVPPPAAAVLPAGRPVATPASPEKWNWHVQNTDIVEYQPRFPAQYSGPNSLINANEVRETVSLDLMAGARLWQGAEVHVDGLMWQGYGLSKTLGVEAFPSAEAYRYGVTIPNVNIPRAFIRQTIGLGGEQEAVESDGLHLAGQQDVSRLTITVGKMSVHDIFDVNTYANDPRTQFLNWGFVANLAWDYPADSLGYITGLAVELNEPGWALRYGFFQMPKVSNGLGVDERYLDAWGMVVEAERRWSLGGHPGAVRFLAFLNRAHMGSYAETLANPSLDMDINATAEYRLKFGFGLNLEQEIIKGIGAFARLGWSDGREQAWAYGDVDHSVSAGVTFNGNFWGRAKDTIGLAGIVNGITKVHQEFLAAGGDGILAGDGALDYGLEQVMETYYDFEIYKSLHGALDYQFIENPAFNQARGPVSVIGGRIHWEF